MTTKKDRLMQQIDHLVTLSILEYVSAGNKEAYSTDRQRLLKHIEDRLTAICRKADAYDGIRDGTTKGKSDARNRPNWIRAFTPTTSRSQAKENSHKH